MGQAARTRRFDGFIAGLGTTTGLRAVVGHWPRSPLGAFTDVMVERADGHRVLVAPDERVADFVSATYTFDEVRLETISARITVGAWEVGSDSLGISFSVGRRTALGALLAGVPRALATEPRWIGAIDAVARRVLPGVRTRGSAGGGREEFYGALDMHAITAARVRWDGADRGALAPVAPPVRFGFGSTPRTPALTRVVTLVRG